VGPLVLIAAAGVASVAVRNWDKKRRSTSLAQWEEIAAALDLKLVPASLELFDHRLLGTINDFSIKVAADHVEGRGQTRYVLRLPKMGAPKMSLSPRSSSRRQPLDAAPPSDGGVTAQTFEQEVAIKAKDRPAVEQFLLPFRRHALLSLFVDQRFSSCEVTDRHIHVVADHIEPIQTADVAGVIDTLVEAARALSPPQDRI